MRRPALTLIALLGVVGVLVVVLLTLQDEGGPGASNDRAGRGGGRPGIVSPTDTGRPPVGTPDAPAVANPLLPEPADPLPETVAAVVLDDGSVSAGLRGRVLDPGGRPLQDVSVIYMPGARDSHRWPSAPDGTVDLDSLPITRTGYDGRFSLDVPWSGPPAGQQWNDAPDVYFDLEGFAARMVPCAGMSSAGLDLGDVMLESGGVLTGRVLDERLRPMPGIRVSIIARAPEPLHVNSRYHGSLSTFLEVVTDASGRFTSRGLFPGRVGYEIIVPGYMPVDEFGLQMASGRRLDVGDIQLSRGGSLAGYVVEEAGVGVPGARVHVTDRDGRTAFIGFDPGDSLGWELEDAREAETTAHTLTDDAGFFDVSGLRGGSFTVYVEADGFEVGKATGLAEGDRGVTVVMTHPARLAVVVVDAGTGRPLPQASLTAVRVAFAGEQELLVEPAGPGRFLVTGAGPAENRLEAHAPGYGRATRYTQGVESPAMQDVTFGLRRGSSVQGLVVNAAGEPVPGANVTMRGIDSALAASSDIIVSRTDDERALGHESTPVPAETISDTSGAFRFGDLMSGSWQLSVEAAGHAPYTHGGSPEGAVLLLGEGEQRDLGRLQLIDQASIIGSVVDRDGEGQPGLEVRVGPLVKARARTDEDGRFEFHALHPGVYDVQSEHDAMQSVEVHAGETAEVQLMLRTAPRLVGTVSAGGAPVEGARVFLREADDRPIWGPMIAERTTHTDDRGDYTIQLASVGEHKLFVTTREGTVVTMDLTLSWDQEQRIDVLFGGGRLSGLVRSAEGEPVMGARVSAARGGGDPGGVPTRGNARTGEDGRFSLSGLWPGEYSLTVRAGGFAPARRGPYTVPAGGTVTDLVVLLERGASLGGRVTQPGLEVVPDDMEVVLVRATDGERVARTGTLAGEYSFQDLPAGRFILKIAEPGEAGDLGVEVFLHEEPLQLAAGEVAWRDVVLPSD